ncbi:hypothetical protein GCM10022380_81320 [Amycolatopsis tucumanensis]|uniref:Uncharacterized protein n=1 Tax=Amycolatopsis tucumanensis TaxID=401106 RepID=A0ABP7JRG4_9PSEU
MTYLLSGLYRHLSCRDAGCVSEVKREFDVLGNLMRINAGMGGATRRMLEFQDAHGHLPPHELREMAGIFRDVGTYLEDEATRIEQASTRPSFRAHA